MGRRSILLLIMHFCVLHVVALPSASASTVTTQSVWDRTDKPVADLRAHRTWMWGPRNNAYRTEEPYADSPNGQRTVIYFDKARMEVTYPDGDTSNPWFVTNGLLVKELVTGQMQVGNTAFEQYEPAPVNVAGDPTDPDGPTYASFANLLAPAADHPGILTGTIDRSGNVGHDGRLGGYGVGVSQYAPETGHWIATPFWSFMTTSDLVYENGHYITASLFESPYYATGLPITEAYWAQVRVGGTPKDVLIQCFERRCLTYTPDNPPGWQVEAGNVGLHYYTWRYGQPPVIPTSSPRLTVPLRIVDVRNVDELRDALSSAQPGDEIRLADGVYNTAGGGSLRASVDGTAEHPIVVTGSRNAVITRGSITDGAGFQLMGADYWILHGFTIEYTRNGIWLENAKHNVIDGVEVRHLGTVGIALNTWSSHNTIQDAWVHHTGKEDGEYGEGIYIGTWVTGWGTRTDGQPDDSSYNVVKNSKIGPGVTAQMIDIKPGSHHNRILYNECDGSGLIGPSYNYNHTLITVAGNDNYFEGNRGYNTWEHGIEIHGADYMGHPGYAQRNTFKANYLDLSGAKAPGGYGFWFGTEAQSAGNVVLADNVVANSRHTANIPLTR